jgi:hypothetical protein
MLGLVKLGYQVVIVISLTLHKSEVSSTVLFISSQNLFSVLMATLFRENACSLNLDNVQT